MCELEKPLEERLTEGRGQVELLTAVVNLRFYHMATSIYKKKFYIFDSFTQNARCKICALIKMLSFPSKSPHFALMTRCGKPALLIAILYNI